MPVDVELATGTTADLRINAVGTLLSADPAVQPILSMGIVAAMGLRCVIEWNIIPTKLLLNYYTHHSCSGYYYCASYYTHYSCCFVRLLLLSFLFLLLLFFILSAVIIVVFFVPFGLTSKGFDSHHFRSKVLTSEPKTRIRTKGFRPGGFRWLVLGFGFRVKG